MIDGSCDGILPIIKPPGITSHDVVGIVRRLLGTKKVGHGGTLDPLAAGVLPVFIGKSTRLVEYTDMYNKTYIAEGKFGISTDTEDCTGQIIEEKIGHLVDYKALEKVVRSFQGRIEQVPSKYSAIRIKGKKAYELARAGKEFVMPTRQVTVFNIRMIAFSYPFFTISVTCSSGTYIRALIRDIGLKLGMPCTMMALLRSVVGPYTIEESYTLEEIEAMGPALLHPSDEAVSHFPILPVSEKTLLALVNGQRITPTNELDNYTSGLYRAYHNDTFVGLVEKGSHIIKAKKILFSPQ